VKQLDQELEQLDLLLRAAGVELSRDVQTQLLRYLGEIIRANETVNLTRIDSIAAGIRLHLLDSLLCLPEVRECPPGKLVDIGTGGGFPGVPLCLASERGGVLLDSVGKKARAVNRAIRLVAPKSGISAAPQRSEGHALVAPAAYAVATARAVAELPALVEMASPLLEVGGRLIALKGSPEETEIIRADGVAEKVGMRRIGTRCMILPGGDERRTIVVYERVGRSETRLPRRPGLAQKNPLA
jgi:16S rRNA (guanine527-N7)-methyltransferase